MLEYYLTRVKQLSFQGTIGIQMWKCGTAMGLYKVKALNSEGS